MPRIAWHLLLILLPVVAAFAILPSLYSNHLMLFNFIIFMTLAQGINVIYGFTGYLPFGYVGFFGAGAYGFSLMVIHLHAPPLIALSAGAAAAIVLALLLTPLFRLSGAYFSIANLAAALAVLQVVSNPNLEEITKGPYGISLRCAIRISAWRSRPFARIRSAPAWPASMSCASASSPGS